MFFMCLHPPKKSCFVTLTTIDSSVKEILVPGGSGFNLAVTLISQFGTYILMKVSSRNKAYSEERVLMYMYILAAVLGNRYPTDTVTVDVT